MFILVVVVGSHELVLSIILLYDIEEAREVEAINYSQIRVRNTRSSFFRQFVTRILWRISAGRETVQKKWRPDIFCFIGTGDEK